MSKYINAAELKLILNREHLNYSQMIEKKFVLNAIDEMSSAEVVEVVRCEDCKYRAKGLPYCAYFGKTEFCSKGERKETNENQ